MSKKKELVKNTIILLFGKLSTQFITFLLLPLYTSILSSKDYGIVDLVTTSSLFLFILISFFEFLF